MYIDGTGYTDVVTLEKAARVALVTAEAHKLGVGHHNFNAFAAETGFVGGEDGELGVDGGYEDSDFAGTADGDELVDVGGIGDAGNLHEAVGNVAGGCHGGVEVGGEDLRLGIEAAECLPEFEGQGDALPG